MWLTSDVKALISDTRIIPAIQYATQASIYAPENTAAELTTAQTVIISFLYALRQRDLPLIKKLLEVSSSVPQIKSTFLSVWLRDDFCFPRGDVAICLSTLGKLLLDGLQFPWSVAATLASLDVKYCIQECFTEADDTAGQILLSTMNASVSEGTQVNFSKELMSKESQTTLVKRVSFQLPLENTSTGTQAGLIVHDRGVSVKPQQSTTGVQTTDHKMIAALTSHSIYPTQKETTSIGTQAGLIVHDQGVSVKPEQSTTGVQTTNQNMGSTLKPSTLTSNSNHTIQKLGNDSGTENRQQNVVNAYRGLQNIPEDLFRSLQTTPNRSYGSLQTTPDHSYGSLPMLSQNQKKTPVSFNDYIFMDRELSFKPEQSTPPIQTIVASDKGSRIGTGILSQSMSANACGSLPMPKRNQTTATVVIDPKTGMDIFPDVLAEMRKQCKKDPAETSKTIAPRSYVYSSNLPKEAVLPEESGAFSLTTEPTAKVRDVSKYLVDTTVPVSSMNRPPVSISKGMANELMYSAIQKNDSKSIVKAINAGADVNDEGVMKKRPLHVAASAGRVELAIELIHWGADVNSLDNWEETPLFVASVAGHILMAEVLISAGANINHINRERNRPLHVAASAGQLEIVRLLLKSGADVDCKGESFRTPLHCAAFRGHLSVVGLLLEHGADPVAIEVNVTPTSKKKRDSDPPPFLVLAPFALVPKISFNNVKLHTTVKTVVFFRNPVDSDIQIALEMHGDLQNIGLELSAHSFNIPGNSTDSLELIWTPSCVVQLRGKICLKHLNGDKKFSYISVACSSVAPQSKKAPPKRLPSKKNNVISKKTNKGEITKPKSVRFADKFPECLSTNSLRRETYEVKEPKLCFPSVIAEAKPRNPDYLINASFCSLKEDELELNFQNSKIVQTSSPKFKGQERRTYREPLKEFNLNIHLGEFQREDFKIDKIDGDISIDLSHLSFDRDSLDSPIQLSSNSALFEISPFKIRSFDSQIKLENRFDETMEDRKPLINLSINSEPIIKNNKHEGTFSIISLCSDSSFEKSHSSSIQQVVDVAKPPQPSLCFEISPLKPILKKSINTVCTQKDVDSGTLHVSKKVEKQKSPKRTDKGVSYEGPHKTFYDEPDYLLHPYGMTAIKDPFSKHSIHCRDWLEKVELELIKWLNSLLRPPKELGSIVEGVDVMKLWDQSTASSLKLAPSREIACKEYVLSDGSHMIALRKAASAFAQSEHMKKTIYNIRAKIQSGFLSVKDNISLHHNQGARVRLVQMIMYYNPLWLRIALEVIYEEVIPLYENNIHRGLVYFLKQNLLSSQYIIEKNKFPKSTHLKPEFTTEMNNFVVLKFLTLVYFLDHAKRKRLVPYDPCLFCKNSPIKDSEGMLNEFIKDFLKCVGHFKKTLKAIGYQLEYRQTYLDEFDYGLSTHLDLRDGVRLARTMEIILKDPSYSQKLWTPAVSRIQKIHNVQVALSALANNGYTINEDIVATDIVNGHREKIYSLIWQILHKFLAPRYQSAAIKIQIWWRKYYAKIHVKKEAAIKIQRWYRKQVERIELKKKEKAAAIIKKWYRHHLQRRYYERNFMRMKNAVSIIEKWYKNIKLCEKDRKAFVLIRASTVKIQCWYRAVVLGREERRKFILYRRSVIKIQLAYRSYREMKLCRDYFLKKKSAAIKVQKWFRSQLLGRNLRTRYLAQKKAAITIQTWWRKLKDRREFLKKIKAASVIQKWYRSTHKKKLDEEALRINKAAALIQAWWHGYITRKRMKKILEEKLKKNSQKSKKQKKGMPLKQLFTNAVGFVCHGGRDLGNLVIAYNDIDVCTVFSPILCLELVKDEYFFEFMWNDLNQGFRDGLYLEIFVHCLNIILKLARFPETIDYLLQSMDMFDGYTILVTLMGKFIEKNTDIFCKAASVIWFLLLTRQDKKLRNSFDLERLKFYHKKIMAKKNYQVEKYRFVPSLRPDWGYTNESASFLSVRTAIEELFVVMS